MSDKYTSAEYQRAVGDFVRREVIYCVSHLVSELASKGGECCGEYYEDVLSVLVQDEWEEPVVDRIDTLDADELRELLELMDDIAPAAYDMDAEMLRPQVLASAKTHGDWRELAEHLGEDPYQREAYEHWIVTDWVADKLEAKGEMVSKDIFGLTVWGRCTTGQAISLDRVICDIYDELHGEG